MDIVSADATLDTNWAKNFRYICIVGSVFGQLKLGFSVRHMIQRQDEVHNEDILFLDGFNINLKYITDFIQTCEGNPDSDRR